MARYLLGDERNDTGDVTLRSDPHGLTVLQQNHQSKLRPITDYSCVSPGEMKLVRKGEGHIKLLPVIDQTVTTTCVFKRDLSLAASSLMSMPRPWRRPTASGCADRCDSKRVWSGLEPRR